MGNIIVLGSINMDVVVTTPRLPLAGETIAGNSLHFIPGGKGSNQAVAAARLGGQVKFVGRLGDDAFGETLHTFLQHEQINLTHLGVLQGIPSGTAIISVGANSENTIIIVPGANAAITPDDVEDIPIQPDDIIVSVLETPQPTIQRLFERAKAVNARTILNPAPAMPLISGLAALTDYLILNETELALLAHQPIASDVNGIAGLARHLLAHPAQTLIVTLGAQGCLCVQADALLPMAGYSVNAVDTTGAGDCFVGAFATALMEQRSLAACLTFANRAASLSVQRLGAATSMPYRRDIE
jgi:ribokinase